MHRALIAFILGTVVLLTMQAVARGGEPEPPDGDLCDPPYDRVMSIALSREPVASLLVAPETSWSFETGVLLRILGSAGDTAPDVSKALEGDLVRADVTPLLPCFPMRLWKRDAALAQGHVVLAVLLVRSDGSIGTTAGWPVVDEQGEAMLASELTRERSVGSLRVRLSDDATRTIDELVQAGRSFVEPEPSPRPEGVPTIDYARVNPDFGTDSGHPSGVALPQTGADGDRPKAWAPFAGGALATVLVATAGIALRFVRRRAR